MILFGSGVGSLSSSLTSTTGVCSFGVGTLAVADVLTLLAGGAFFGGRPTPLFFSAMLAQFGKAVYPRSVALRAREPFMDDVVKLQCVRLGLTQRHQRILSLQTVMCGTLHVQQWLVVL